MLPFVQSVVLSGGTVHTLAPGAAPLRADVVITDGKIAALVEPGAKTGVPADAQRVDATGLHLTPGLVDGMVNHDAEHDRLYVASGVTFVRDLGGELTQALAERDLVARNRGPGPAIWAAGAPIGADALAGIVIASPEAAQDKLPRLFAEAHPDYLSILPSLPLAAWKSVLTLAHAQKLTVWGPLRRGSSLNEVLDAGQDGLFHVDALLPSGKSWSEVTLAELTPRIERLAASRTALVPTLAYHATRLVEPKADAPELRTLSPIYAQAWTLDAELRRYQYTGDDGVALQKAGLAALQLMFQSVKLAHDKGAVLVPGSASPHPWLLPGRALVEELVLWGRAGIPAPDVLRAATAGATRVFGDASRGTLAVGQVADLCAYAGDPEQDLAVLRDPRLVVLRGRVLARTDLDRLLAELEVSQRAQQLRVLGKDPLPLAELPASPGEVRLSGEVEQRIRGLRYSAEKYAVSVLPDGALRYQTRMLTLGAVATADTQLYLEQTVRENRLEGFALEVKNGVHTITVKGTLTGNVLNIERHGDASFAGNVPVREKLAFVDVGSVLSAIAVGQHGREGQFKVLFFDAFEPAFGPWELHVEDSGKLIVRPHDGALTASFDAAGRPGELARELGRGITRFDFLRNETHGTGLALPAPNVRAPK